MLLWTVERLGPQGWMQVLGAKHHAGADSPLTVSEPLAGHSRYQRSCLAGWKNGVGPLPELERTD